MVVLFSLCFAVSCPCICCSCFSNVSGSRIQIRYIKIIFDPQTSEKHEQQMLRQLTCKTWSKQQQQQHNCVTCGLQNGSEMYRWRFHPNACDCLQPRNGQKCSLMTLAVLRLAFPPLFMMCNIHPDHRNYFSVKLHSDWWPALLTVGLGLTNGYVGTLSMLYGPT